MASEYCASYLKTADLWLYRTLKWLPSADPIMILGPKAQGFPDNIALHSLWFNFCFVYGCFSRWVLVAVLVQRPPELVLAQQRPELSNINQCWGKLSRGKSSISEALLELNKKVLFPWCPEVLFVIWWMEVLQSIVNWRHYYCRHLVNVLNSGSITMSWPFTMLYTNQMSISICFVFDLSRYI